MEKLRHLCIGIIVAVIILILVHLGVAILSFGNKRFLLPIHQEDTTLVGKPLPSHFHNTSVEDSLFTEYVRSLDYYYQSWYSQIIQSADARIGRELNNLNLWITVWVLLIGGVTIALPMVSQYTGYSRVKNKITELKKQILKTCLSNLLFIYLFAIFGILIFIGLLIYAGVEHFLSNFSGTSTRGLYITIPLIADILLFLVLRLICKLSTYDVFKKCKTNSFVGIGTKNAYFST